MAKTAKPKPKKVKKEKKQVAEAKFYVSATFNNTLVTISDPEGNVLEWTSSGRLGFKGTRKSTPFASITTVEEAIRRAVDLGVKKIQVYIKGPGPGRDAALRALRGVRGLDVTMVSDVTPIPHNGPRPPKRKRG